MSDEVFSLTETSGSDLSALLYGSEGLISPFSQEIYIGRQTIVGMRFQGGAESLVNDLRPGDRISFLREPENEYDERAIMAVDGRGRKLGYIPRRENRFRMSHKRNMHTAASTPNRCWNPVSKYRLP